MSTSASATSSREHAGEKVWVVALAILGVVFLVLGVVYVAITAPHLPAFLPGAVSHHVRHERAYTKRGLLAILLAVGCFAVAFTNSNLRRSFRRGRAEA